MSRSNQISLGLVLVIALIGLATVRVNGQAAGDPTMITPYLNEADLGPMNEAFSFDACAPWGFPHNGIDFFPKVDAEPFRAVFSGTVERIELFLMKAIPTGRSISGSDTIRRIGWDMPLNLFLLGNRSEKNNWPTSS